LEDDENLMNDIEDGDENGESSEEEDDDIMGAFVDDDYDEFERAESDDEIELNIEKGEGKRSKAQSGGGFAAAEDYEELIMRSYLEEKIDICQEMITVTRILFVLLPNENEDD